MGKNEKLKENRARLYHFLPFIGAGIVLCVHMLGIQKMKVPTILYDEAGYWVSAAHFAGKNWNGVTSPMSYYSYGIGLILSLFMRIGETPVITYQMVMVFNLVLVLICYIFAYRICQYIFPAMEKKYWVVISTVCMMFSTFIMNSQIAWTEHYLSFLFWLEIYLLMNILKKPGFINCSLYVLSIFYSYMVHQRAIVLLLMSAIIVADLLYIKKINFKHVILMMVIFIAMMAVHFLIKSDIKHNVWSTLTSQAKSVSENDYGGRIEILLFCIKNKGIMTIIRSFIGKLFYLVIATAGVCIFSFKDFVEKGVKLIKKKWLDDNERLVIYISLLFFVAMLLNIMTNMEDGVSTVLYSTLVYGRYMEWAVPPLLLIGLGNLLANKYSFSFFAKIISFILLLSVCIYYFYSTANFDKWMASCVGGATWFYDNIDGDKKTYVFLAAQVIILLLLGVGFLIKKRKTYALIIIALYFGLTGLYLRETIVYYIQTNNQRLISTANRILEVDENIPLYYVIKENGDASNVSLLILQYLLEDYEMAYIQEEDLKSLREPYYLLVADYSSELYPDYIVVEDSNPVMSILVRKDNEYLIQKFLGEK